MISSQVGRDGWRAILTALEPTDFTSFLQRSMGWGVRPTIHWRWIDPVSAGIDWKSPNPHSRVRDGDEGAALERSGGIIEDGSERLVHKSRCHVRQAEGHDTRYGIAAQGDDSPEVEIVRDDGPPFNLSLDDDLFVGQALQPLIPEVNSVVTERPEKLGGGLGEAHVQEEPDHAVSVAGRN